MTNDEYMACVAEVRLDLITATAAIAALSSFLMGLLANLPVGLAPGLGLNAYVGLVPFKRNIILTLDSSHTLLLDSTGLV